MKKFLIIKFACIFLSLASPAQLVDPEIRELKNGHNPSETRYRANGEFDIQATRFVPTTRSNYLGFGQ